MIAETREHPSILSILPGSEGWETVGRTTTKHPSPFPSDLVNKVIRMLPSTTSFSKRVPLRILKGL